MTNNNYINEAIAILQTMNMEDCAMAIQDLQHELERVKGIAYRRLDRIAQLQHEVAVLEDKLEDTRSDLKAAEREAELSTKLAENRLERIFNLLGAIDSPNPVLLRDSDLAWEADELVEELLGVEHDDVEPRL